MTLHIPVGINPTSIGVDADWWLSASRRAEEAGFGTTWIWDHFISRGVKTDPLLECWTMLAAASVATERICLGSFVTNVMNRHPAVLARMVATVADLAPGRVELGIGIGGHPAEHEAYGIDWPAAGERAERLEEAIDVLRLLFTGGPVDYEGRYYRLREAHAFPAPRPVPRITIGGETPAGARLAARVADAWTCFADRFETLLPVFDEALAAAGRERADVPVLVGIDVGDAGRDLDALTADWRARGATELIVSQVGPDDLDGLVEAAHLAA
jgi:G6PDH family F420-dependent oxidoreductase